MQRKIYLSFILACFITPALFARIYYVSAKGNDQNNGSISSPWKTIARINRQQLQPGDSILFKRNDTFRGNLIPCSGNANAYMFYGAYGKGNKPLLLGSVNRSYKTDWISIGNNLWQTSGVFLSGTTNAADAGNIIFNNEESCGWKLSSKELLQKQGDFYSDTRNASVILYSVSNPGRFYSNIEIALKKNVIDESFRSFIIYQDIDIRYTAAHGIGGTKCNNIIIRDMDFSFIGGGYHEGLVRYGNGVEFYNDAHDNIVEQCCFNQIYDVAMTPQGDLDNYKVYNIIFRNNIVTHCEQSFEFWVRGKNAIAENIYFINNTCLDAGSTWAHEQREKYVTSHLLFWGSNAPYNNIYICNNIFCNSQKAGIFEASPRLRNLQRPNVIIDYNCWYITDTASMLATVARWTRGTPNIPTMAYTTWSNYKQLTGQDEHSLFEDPRLDIDLRPMPGSPCIGRGIKIDTVINDPAGNCKSEQDTYTIGAFEAEPEKPAIEDKTAEPKTVTDMVSVSVKVNDPDYIFMGDDPASITATLVNKSKAPVKANVKFTITTDKKVPVATATQKLKLKAGGQLAIPFTQKLTHPGFYITTVNVAIADSNVSPIVTNIGYEPEKIVAPADARPDFDSFWNATLKELSSIPLNVKLTHTPQYDSKDYTVFEVELTSWNNEQVKGYYARPKREGKFPASLLFQGYGAKPSAPDTTWDGFAHMLVSVRGQGLNLPQNKYGDWITYGLDNKENYYYRGAYMDLIRAIDFIVTRPEIDTTKIIATGGSQGGAFTFVAAALDKRIKACSPWIPFLSDFKNYFSIVAWPKMNFDEAIKKDPQLHWGHIYEVLSYFDIKNFAHKISCPLFMGIGVQDMICPGQINFAAYNNVNAAVKSWVAYPREGHGMSSDFFIQQQRFIQQQLHLNNETGNMH
ncbi:MAG: acetylxylan esterase [Agriterribacter sp.]